MFSDFLFFENRTDYEIMWKNIVQLNRPQITTWRMRIACWIHKATNTQPEYAIFTALLLQRWLQKTHLIVTLCVRCLSPYAFLYTYYEAAVRQLPGGILEDILSTVDIICFLSEKVIT